MPTPTTSYAGAQTTTEKEIKQGYEFHHAVNEQNGSETLKGHKVLGYHSVLPTVLKEEHGGKDDEGDVKGVCKRTFGSRWALQLRIIHWMYTAVIRPILSYGALLRVL